MPCSFDFVKSKFLSETKESYQLVCLVCPINWSKIAVSNALRPQNHTANSQHLDKMLNITNIIPRKRDKNSNPNASNKPNISTVPESIMGEVPSYLPQTDYASFSVTNTSIHLSCNDLKTLKHVDLL